MTRTRNKVLTTLLVAVLFVCLATLAYFALPARGVNAADNNDGGITTTDTSTESGGSDISQSVASVGTDTNKYDTLASAVAAAQNNEVVTLLADTNECITVAAGQTITLDLNGFVLTGEGADTIVNNGTLTVVDGSEAKSGAVDNLSHAKAALVNHGTAVLSGGTFKRSQEAGTDPDNNGGNSYYVIDSNSGTGSTVSSITINEGVTVYHGASADVAGNYKFSSLMRNGGEKAYLPGDIMIINGGDFYTGLNTVKNDDEEGVLDINGGNFHSATRAVLNWGHTTIDGGVFDGEVVSWFGDKYGATADTVSMAITSGTFLGKVASEDYDKADAGQEATLDYGTTISGGSFSEAINSAYVPADKVLYPTDDGFAVNTFETAVAQGNGIAQIGNVLYDSLAKAVDAVEPGQAQPTVITIVGEGDVISGPGVKVNGQNIIIDLNGKTYNVINPTVGSQGTETNAFQMLAGSTVVFRNGALKSDVAIILLQNYCDLTLEDVIIDATDSASIRYLASNNNGSFTAKGNTQLIAGEGQVAFDVYYNLGGGYPDGVTVNFGEDFAGKVVGKVEYGVAVATENWQSKTQLNIQNGEFDISIAPSGTSAADANINISGGSFTQIFDGAYLAGDMMLYPTESGDFAVADQATAERESVGVAQIGQIIYKTLGDALAAAKDGDEIDLLADISAPGQITITNDITLDFNGYTIDSNMTIAITISGANANIISTGAQGTLNAPANGISVINGSIVNISDININTDVYVSQTSVYDGRAIQIVASTAVIDNVVTSLTAENTDYTIAHWYIGDSDVKIINSDITLVYSRSEASSTNDGLQGYAVYIDNSDVVIEKSSISSTGDETAYGVVFFGNMAIADAAASDGTGFKTLSITDTSVIADAFAITGNGSANDCSGTDIVIAGNSKIESNYAPAIYHPQYGVLTINLTDDSTLAYIRGVSGIEMRAGKLVVLGGYIEATGNELDSMPNGNGSTTSGAAIAIVQHTTKQPIDVRLDGGVFTGVFAVYEENQQGNEQAAIDKISLSINDGVFNGNIGSQNLTGFVNGGKFIAQPEKTYFADNYTGELYNGYYVVIEAVTEDSVALSEAQLAAQADARNYLAALGLTLSGLEGMTDSGAADIVAAYEAIADTTSISGAQLAKLRLMNAADEFVAAQKAALDAYKAEKIDALATLAGQQVTVPTYAIEAINNAETQAEVDAYYNSAVAEINAAIAGAQGEGTQTPPAAQPEKVNLTGVYVMLGVILIVAVAALMVALLMKQKKDEKAAEKPEGPSAPPTAPLDTKLSEVKQEVMAQEAAATATAAASDDIDVDDDDKEQIVIAANVRSFDEAYDELDDEQKKLFNAVKDYALSKEGAAEAQLSSGICVKKGSKQIVKLTVRRGNPVALFVLENEMLKDFRRNNDSPIKLKVRATELVLREEGDLEAARTMVDLSVDQIDKDVESAKERRREARRLRRMQKKAQEQQQDK